MKLNDYSTVKHLKTACIQKSHTILVPIIDSFYIQVELYRIETEYLHIKTCVVFGLTRDFQTTRNLLNGDFLCLK